MSKEVTNSLFMCSKFLKSKYNNDSCFLDPFDSYECRNLGKSFYYGSRELQK